MNYGAVHKATIDSQEKILDNTIQVNLRVEDVGFFFRAGQYVKLQVPDLPEDPVGNMRSFSVASPPENLPIISIAVRVHENIYPFKKELINLPVGSIVNVYGPFGNFTLPEDSSRGIVFIAGGIGITPFLSILHSAERNNLQHKITLLYYNKNESEEAYKKELEGLAGRNKNFSLAERYGFFEPGHLKEIFSLEDGPIFYLAGPPKMVEVVFKALLEMGAAKEDIHTEEFIGY